ncbi:MAG: FAD-dependent oxidoreductase [Candidatus Micrarchaeota archaeon]
MALVPFAVKSAQMHGQFCTLTATPEKRFLFSAGQFAKVYLAPSDPAFVVLSFYSAEGDKDVQFLFHPHEGGIKGALSGMKPGEKIYVDGPYGVFKLRNSRSPKVFFSKKMGIVPVCSMVRTLLSKKSRPKICIFSENSGRDEIPDEGELRKCAREKGVFLLITLLNQKPLNWGGETGEFSAEDITGNVRDYGEAQFYLCGPVPFVNRMRAILHDLRVQERNIFFEQWG